VMNLQMSKARCRAGHPLDLLSGWLKHVVPCEDMAAPRSCASTRAVPVDIAAAIALSAERRVLIGAKPCGANFGTGSFKGSAKRALHFIEGLRLIICQSTTRHGEAPSSTVPT
jgi:hypothetical protein